MRIALLTDTHLATNDTAVLDNAAAARQWIEALRPDRVVHLGDIVANGVQAPLDYRLALRSFGGVAPMYWLPGNHDIGEDATTAANTGEQQVSRASLAAWRAAFGSDYWRCDAPGWTVLGLNAQLFGSDGEENAAQLAWLEEQLATTRARLGIMLHKPLFRDGPEDTDTHRRYLPLAARRALWLQLMRHDLRFVACGHTHQWRQYRSAGVEHVWVPSAAYVFADSLQETIGRKVVGAMVLDLTADGHQFAFVEVDGIRQHELRAHD